MINDSNRPTISVCIANYNGMEVIDACLQSVMQQTIKYRIEIIIHDDASTDGSAVHIRRHYPDLLLIESRDNVGFCVANNRMGTKARGDYILLLNNDAELLPDALQTLLNAAQASKKTTILSLPQYDAQSGEVIDRGCFLDPFFNPIPNLDPSRRDVAMVIGACLWLPRELWEKIGGFPEWFGSIGEDLYLCCQARLLGCSVQVLAASGYRHWVGMSFGGGKPQDGKLVSTFRRRALSERNKTFAMIMTCPTPVIQILLPLHLLLLLIEGLLLATVTRQTNSIREIYLPIPKALFQFRTELAKGRKANMIQKRAPLLALLSAFHIMPYKLRMLLKHGLPLLK